MNRTSLVIIFHKKLIQWILIPGLLMGTLIVSIIGINQMDIMEREIIQLSKSLSKNVNFYIDGAEDVLRSVAIMSANNSLAGGNKYFEGLHSNFRRFERLILLDKDENIISVAPQGIKGVDFPIRFSGAGKNKHILTSPIISPHSGKLVVYISIPTESGGKIVAELSLDALQKFIYGFLSPNRIIILTDSYGNLIAHPDRERVRTQSNIGSLDIFKNLQSSDKGIFYKADGKLYFGNISRIPGTGWKLLVACTANYMFEPVITLGLIIFTLITCFFLILLFAIKKEFRIRIANPIMTFIKKLSDVAKGNYPTSNSQESDFIELHKLGKVFDSMSLKVREREQELRISKTFFQSIIDSMPSAVLWVDDNMMVSQYNKKAIEIFGGETEEIIPQNFEVFFSSNEEISKTIEQAIRHKSTKTLESRSVNEKSHKLYDITVFPLLGSEVEGMVVRIDDVTSRIRMEEIMVQTEKMMSVGGLAAGMAHEINNPLGSIIQGAQNLERRFSSKIEANIEAAQDIGCSLEILQEYLEIRRINHIISGIRDAGLRAASIVSNMLEFSKPVKR